MCPSTSTTLCERRPRSSSSSHAWMIDSSCARVYRLQRLRLRSFASSPVHADSRSTVLIRSTRPALGTHSSTSWHVSRRCSVVSSGGRRTRSELETETVRRVYVLFEVQSTASSDGRPLIVNLASVKIDNSSLPYGLAALDCLQDLSRKLEQLVALLRRFGGKSNRQPVVRQ